jgi:hypothetical protein
MRISMPPMNSAVAASEIAHRKSLRSCQRVSQPREHFGLGERLMALEDLPLEAASNGGVLVCLRLQ